MTRGLLGTTVVVEREPCVLIVTIPFGLQAFKLAGHLALRAHVVKRPGSERVGGGQPHLAAFPWLVAHLGSALTFATTNVGDHNHPGCRSRWPA
jgi:hypothetical protein